MVLESEGGVSVTFSSVIFIGTPRFFHSAKASVVGRSSIIDAASDGVAIFAARRDASTWVVSFSFQVNNAVTNCSATVSTVSTDLAVSLRVADCVGSSVTVGSANVLGETVATGVAVTVTCDVLVVVMVTVDGDAGGVSFVLQALSAMAQATARTEFVSCAMFCLPSVNFL